MSDPERITKYFRHTKKCLTPQSEARFFFSDQLSFLNVITQPASASTPPAVVNHTRFVFRAAIQIIERAVLQERTRIGQEIWKEVPHTVEAFNTEQLRSSFRRRKSVPFSDQDKMQHYFISYSINM